MTLVIVTILLLGLLLIATAPLTKMNKAADSIVGGVEIIPFSVRGSQRKSRLKEIVEEIEENTPHPHAGDHDHHGP